MAKILLVDDDLQFQQMLKQYLERNGFEVMTAANGKEAVELFKQDTFDLIITDIIMPEKEGIETIIEMKKEKPEIKIIAISGGGRIDADDYLIYAKRFGACHTFTKPIDRDAFISKIREVLTKSELGE